MSRIEWTVVVATLVALALPIVFLVVKPSPRESCEATRAAWVIECTLRTDMGSPAPCTDVAMALMPCGRDK